VLNPRIAAAETSGRRFARTSAIEASSLSLYGLLKFFLSPCQQV